MWQLLLAAWGGVVHAWLGEASLVEIMACRRLAQITAEKPCESEPCALIRLFPGAHTLHALPGQAVVNSEKTTVLLTRLTLVWH